GDENNDGANDSGAVYVFHRSGQSWEQQAYLKASNSDAADRFGLSLSLSGDTLAVGALSEDSSARGVGGDESDNGATDSGAVYVFHRSEQNWQQQAYLKASNSEENDLFGTSVSLYGDTLAVGASEEDSSARGVDGGESDNGVENSGAVYMFHRSGQSWEQRAYLKASNTGVADAFGRSVSLSGDALVVGASSEDGSARGIDGNENGDGLSASGAIYVFQ
ncbi:MAG: FG-GAP repeat protein, partial [Myxococcota bacterium]